MCCDDCIGCAGTSVQIIEMLVDLLLNVVTVARMDLPLELLMLICSAQCTACLDTSVTDSTIAIAARGSAIVFMIYQ